MRTQAKKHKPNWKSFFTRICAQLGCMTAELAAQRAQRGLSQNCEPALPDQPFLLLPVHTRARGQKLYLLTDNSAA